MYSCLLFLISSVSVRYIPFLSFIVPIFAWNVPLVSLVFLKRSLVFPILLFSSISLHWLLEEGFPISPYFSFELCIQMGISFLFSFAFCFSSVLSYLLRPPQTAILPFCISFSGGWSGSLSPVQCHEPPSIGLQALYLSDLIPWIYLSLPVYNCKGFDLDHIWML